MWLIPSEFLQYIRCVSVLTLKSAKNQIQRWCIKHTAALQRDRTARHSWDWCLQMCNTHTYTHLIYSKAHQMTSLCPLRAARCRGVLQFESEASFRSPSNRDATILLLNNSWATYKWDRDQWHIPHQCCYRWLKLLKIINCFYWQAKQSSNTIKYKN